MIEVTVIDLGVTDGPPPSQLWTPTAPVPSIVAGGAVGPQASDVLTAMENNQRRLCRNREAIL